MIIRLILAGIVIALVIGAMRKLRAARVARQPVIEAKMVRCATCGVYLPAAEAHRVAGKIYCSDEHVRDNRDS